MKKIINFAFSYFLFGLIVNGYLLTNCLSQKDNSNEVSQLAYSDTTLLAIDFQAIDLHNKPFHGMSLKGKTVLVDVWAVWCAPCIAAFPTLKQMNSDFKDKGFEVVGVAVYSGTPEDVSEFLKEHELNYKVVVGDADLVERFGVIGYPTYFLINPDGKIYKKYVGQAKNLYSEVKADILELHNNRSGQ